MNVKLKNSNVIPYPVAKSEIITIKNSKKSKKVTLLFASRNDPVKGGQLLTKALELLPKNIQSKIQVEFYGYVPQRDLTHLSFLQVNEFVPKEDLEKAYQTADICVIPSLFDNSPNTRLPNWYIYYYGSTVIQPPKFGHL